jgi:choline kinase
MIALILAAGTATRLRPLTEYLPKTLLEVGNKRIIDFQIETLLAEGIWQIIIVTGYKAEYLENYLKNTYPDTRFTFVRNTYYESSGAAYSIILALSEITEQTIYLNGDVIYDPQILKRIIRSHHPSVTAIQKNEWDEEQVNVILGKDNNIKKISKIIKREESCGEFIGVTKLGYEFIAQIKECVRENKEKFRYSFAIDLLNQIITTGKQKLYALDVTLFRAIEIDTADDLKVARDKFK